MKLTSCYFGLIMYWSTAKMSSNNLLWGIFTVNIEVFNSGNKSACI